MSILSRWLTLVAILPVAFGAQNGSQPAPQQTITNLKTKLWEGAVLVADIFADSATLHDHDYDKEMSRGELRGGRVIYYTQPRSPEETSQKVTIKFASGTVDGKKKTFALRDGVKVDMEDGSRLETDDLFVDYPLQQFSTKGRVAITRPNSSLTGTGFMADDMLRLISISREGVLEFAGRPADGVPRPGRPAAPPSPVLTRLSSDGPLSIKDLSLEMPGPGKFTMIAARDGVRVERREPDRRLVSTADSAVIYISRPKGDDGGVEPLSATLRGSIRIEDSAGSQASAATMDWNAQDDLMRLTGAPFVEVVQGGQRVRARSVVIDRLAGRSTFKGDLQGTFSASVGGAMDFTAHEFEILTDPLAGRPQPTEMLASGEVHISGAAGGDAGTIDARGSSFWWSMTEDRGILRGLPYAHVDQGENRIDAPEIVMEGRSTLVIKGPKRLNFVRVQPTGERSEITALAAGDVVYDGRAGRVTLSDHCEVRTDDFRLRADRLFLNLASDGKGIDSLAGFGRVRAERTGIFILGDAFEYDPQKRAIKIGGEPYAVASFQGLETLNASIRIDQQTGRIEFEGGRYGGHIRLPRE